MAESLGALEFVWKYRSFVWERSVNFRDHLMNVKPSIQSSLIGWLISISQTLYVRHSSEEVVLSLSLTSHQASDDSNLLFENRKILCTSFHISDRRRPSLHPSQYQPSFTPEYQPSFTPELRANPLPRLPVFPLYFRDTSSLPATGVSDRCPSPWKYIFHAASG